MLSILLFPTRDNIYNNKIAYSCKLFETGAFIVMLFQNWANLVFKRQIIERGAFSLSEFISKCLKKDVHTTALVEVCQGSSVLNFLL